MVWFWQEFKNYKNSNFYKNVHTLFILGEIVSVVIRNNCRYFDGGSTVYNAFKCNGSIIIFNVKSILTKNV